MRRQGQIEWRNLEQNHDPVLEEMHFLGGGIDRPPHRTHKHCTAQSHVLTQPWDSVLTFGAHENICSV